MGPASGMRDVSPGESSPDALGDSATLLEALLGQVDLSEATDYARKGHFEKAEEVLNRLGSRMGSHETRALDLLARIRAQQGRLGEAQALWRSALGEDPGNERFLAALARTRREIRRMVHFGPAWLRAATGLFIILAGLSWSVLVWATLRTGRGLTSALATVEAFQEPVPGALASLADSADEQARRLATIEAMTNGASSEVADLGQEFGAFLATSTFNTATVATATAEAQESLERVAQALDDLGTEGVRVRQGKGFVVVTFSEGLFSSGVDFAPGAPAVISAVGSVLHEADASLRVVVVGYSDSGEAGGELATISLGLLRAAKVMEYLHDAGYLPATAITVELAGERPAPYPNDSPDSQLRNRTVTLVIESYGP